MRMWPWCGIGSPAPRRIPACTSPTRTAAGITAATPTRRRRAGRWQRPIGYCAISGAGAPVPPDFDPGDDAACAAVLTRALVAGREIDPWPAVVLGSQVLPMRAGTGSQTLPPVTAADRRQARP
ncbi:hypothetical protein [Nocardia sp. CA-290969]|uniref:hypothetical protein n=1 Tax=Nocardia sp. CA-290969 TaxID=3239986 RepID=UPI003D92427B